jgi:hypothetical protein
MWLSSSGEVRASYNQDATVMDLILASSDTVESEGRHFRQIDRLGSVHCKLKNCIGKQQQNYKQRLLRTNIFNNVPTIQ